MILFKKNLGTQVQLYFMFLIVYSKQNYLPYFLFISHKIDLKLVEQSLHPKNLGISV